MRAISSAESGRIYRRRVDRVIDYIKAHLAEPLPLAELARVAHFSPFHFHRIFGAVAGEPPHAFIRRLRLEQAIWRMQHGAEATLTAIALECGFGSSSDFSRAFRQAYGMRPRDFTREAFLKESKIRQDLPANLGQDVGAMPDPANPDRFRVRLVERPAQRIAYERVIGGFDPGRIVAAFDRLTDWGRRHGLGPEAQLIGRSADNPDATPKKRYQFDWCLVLPAGVPDDGGPSIGEIPAGRFAAVHCAGDVAREARAWRHLFHVWLPAGGFEPADGAMLEVYRRHPLQGGWDTFDMDCCLPVRPLRRR